MDQEFSPEIRTNLEGRNPDRNDARARPLFTFNFLEIMGV